MPAFFCLPMACQRQVDVLDRSQMNLQAVPTEVYRPITNQLTTVQMVQQIAPNRPTKPLFRCPQGFFNQYASSGNQQDGMCDGPEDCLNIGYAIEKSRRLDPYCVFSENLLYSGCCYIDTSNYCKEGVSTLPAIKCTTLDDCNTGNGQTTQRWCDRVTKQCCRNETGDNRQLCPDKVTPLMSEPACTGYNHSDWKSGKCPVANGVCFKGHCCPPVVPFEGPPYRTRFKCTNSTKVPLRYKRGYCNPKTGTIWIMGSVNFKGQPIKQLNSMCMANKDCGGYVGHDNVCVRHHKRRLYCYINPETLYYVPKPLGLTTLSVISYIALATSFVTLILSVFYKLGDDEPVTTISREGESLISAVPTSPSSTLSALG
uniref:DX domain-containing protein n=1 Tax=Caenorhabditis japonica TaxID=281687 RepID=A0A8R1HIX7_CAEJA